MWKIIFIALFVTANIYVAFYVSALSYITIIIYHLLWLALAIFSRPVGDEGTIVGGIAFFIHCSTYFNSLILTIAILLDMIFVLFCLCGDNKQNNKTGNSLNNQPFTPMPNTIQQSNSISKKKDNVSSASQHNAANRYQNDELSRLQKIFSDAAKKEKIISENRSKIRLYPQQDTATRYQNDEKNHLQKMFLDATKKGKITIEHVKDMSLVNRMNDYQMFKTIEEKSKAKILKLALKAGLLEELLFNDYPIILIERKMKSFIINEGLDYDKAFGIITMVYNCLKSADAPSLANHETVVDNRYNDEQISFTALSHYSGKKDRKSSTNSYYDNVKDVFLRDPDEARRMFAIPIDDFELSVGRTLYKGNQVLCKDCVKRLCRHLGMPLPVFEKSKKHSLHFCINRSSCLFNSKGAQIECSHEDEEMLLTMARYIYPDDFIYINDGINKHDTDDIALDALVAM